MIKKEYILKDIKYFFDLEKIKKAIEKAVNKNLSKFKKANRKFLKVLFKIKLMSNQLFSLSVSNVISSKINPDSLFISCRCSTISSLFPVDSGPKNL